MGVFFSLFGGGSLEKTYALGFATHEADSASVTRCFDVTNDTLHVLTVPVAHMGEVDVLR